MIDLFGVDGLDGLITYADLNKIPVRFWLFILISKLDVLLQLIKQFNPASGWNMFTNNRRKKISNQLNDKRKDDIDKSMEDCLNIGDMIEIIQYDNIVAGDRIMEQIYRQIQDFRKTLFRLQFRTIEETI